MNEIQLLRSAMIMDFAKKAPSMYHSVPLRNVDVSFRYVMFMHYVMLSCVMFLFNGLFHRIQFDFVTKDTSFKSSVYWSFGRFLQITKKVTKKSRCHLSNGLNAYTRIKDTLLNTINSKKFVFMSHFDIFRKLQKVQGIL